MDRLREAPDVLHCVSVNIAPNPFLYRVVDRLVGRVVVSDAFVRRPLIGEVGGCLIGCNLANEAMKGCPVSGADDLEDDLATPFNSAHDGSPHLVGPGELHAA